MELLRPLLEPLNKLIMMAGDAGVGNLIYQLWNIVNITVTTAFLLCYRKHYGIKWLPALLFPFICYAVGDLFILMLGWISTGFKYFGSNNIVKGFSFFPLFALIPVKLFKLDWKTAMDFTAPAYPLLQFSAHIACNFAGCCHGHPMYYGIWNPNGHCYMFPSQLLESFVSLIIFIICLVYSKKRDYKVTGKVYPLFLILFGGTRFFLEFLRFNTKLFWGISDLALWALLMVIVGVVWLIIAKKKGISLKTAVSYDEKILAMAEAEALAKEEAKAARGKTVSKNASAKKKKNSAKNK